MAHFSLLQFFFSKNPPKNYKSQKRVRFWKLWKMLQVPETSMFWGHKKLFFIIEYPTTQHPPTVVVLNNNIKKSELNLKSFLFQKIHEKGKLVNVEYDTNTEFATKKGVEIRKEKDGDVWCPSYGRKPTDPNSDHVTKKVLDSIRSPGYSKPSEESSKPSKPSRPSESSKSSSKFSGPSKSSGSSKPSKSK